MYIVYPTTVVQAMYLTHIRLSGNNEPFRFEDTSKIPLIINYTYLEKLFLLHAMMRQMTVK